MIQYDPHRWFDHFFDVRGTLVKEIGGRVAICVIWAVGVVWVHFYVRAMEVPVTIHSLVGVALGLLLVFRTNASYDRYWEGRKLWGGIVNECRNLVRGAMPYLQSDAELFAQLVRWTAIFPYAAASTLRGESHLGPAAAELSEAERTRATSAQHLALYVSQQMTRVLRTAVERGLISDIIYTSLDQNTQLLIDYVGGCERIRNTPLPFAYVVHLRRALVIYCFTLPFALVESFGWSTILDVFLVAYVFFGIEEIGVEIEGPFGNDENDLPLGTICDTIQRNLYAAAGLEQSAREIASLE